MVKNMFKINKLIIALLFAPVLALAAGDHVKLDRALGTLGDEKGVNILVYVVPVGRDDRKAFFSALNDHWAGGKRKCHKPLQSRNRCLADAERPSAP